MKESNPISLRYGISNTRSTLVALTYQVFTAKLRIELFFDKLFLHILESEFYYSIVYPVLIPINGKLVAYFYFYITQFTIRNIRVRKRRLKKKRFEESGVLHGSDIIDFEFTKKGSNVLHNLLAYQPFRLTKRPKGQTASRRARYKKTKAKTTQLIFHCKILQFKRVIEDLIFKELQYVGRCHFKNVFALFTSSNTRQITYQVYIIYQRFQYYKRATNFIDSINILIYTLYCGLPNLLISFMCRELERTRLHNKFLRMVRQVMSEFYEHIDIFTAIKFIIKGPVNRHGRTKTIKYTFGAVPCQTFTKDINYFNFFSNTKFGTVGLRLWVY
jgi:hypothetical protein